MKLIVQVPCYNEEENLPDVVRDIPEHIPGIDELEILIIDDGSTDRTLEVAKELGIHHTVINTGNKGLAYSFHAGIEECLKRGADIIVNTDGDNQYDGKDISHLVQPIINGEADIVVGDRGGYNNPHFSPFKRTLQVFGSFVIRKATGLDIKDAVSGFRAISRSAAQQINIVSDFSYTIEMLVQAAAKRLRVTSIPIHTHKKTRESRLFRSIPQFLFMSVTTLLRIYTMYKPLRVFFTLGVLAMISGLLPIIRFIYFYLTGSGEGHIQSLVLGAALVTLGLITLLVGVVADLINFNRKLMEKMLYRMEKLEDTYVNYKPPIVRIKNNNTEVENPRKSTKKTNSAL